MPRFNASSALLLKTAIDSGITSPTELANVMGNAAVETGNFSRMHENFGYRSVDRLVSQVRSAESRYTREQIQAAIDSKDPQQIATIMYEGRSGRGDLGNTEPGDGWKFHGRGYFQYTGRSNYTIYGEKFGVDLVNNPDIAAEPVMAAKLAIAYWKDKIPEHMRDDSRAAGRKINGGDNGAEARVAASRQWVETITPELVKDIQTGRTTVEQLAARGVDPTVERLQQNLNALGFTDVRGQPLVVDGVRGGPGGHTNQAIAAFEKAAGLIGKQSSGDLLTATESALNALQPLRRFDQALSDLGRSFPVPKSAQLSQTESRMVNGMRDYLLPGRDVPAPHRNTSAQPAEATALPPPLAKAGLQQGDHGAAVLALQEHLRLIGATDREGQALKADRDYGARTKEAVEQFQLWTGRETTGIADKDTLQALETQAQFVARQRAQGVSPGDHMVDNLKPLPVSANTGLVADPRLPSGQEVAQPIPATSLQAFSDPAHPQHALYASLQQRFLAKGHTLSEEQLSALTGQMHSAGAKPGWHGDVIVHNDKAFAQAAWPPGVRVQLDLQAPAPSVQDTMRNFQADQQNMMETLEMLRQQQATAQEHSHGLGR